MHLPENKYLKILYHLVRIATVYFVALELNFLGLFGYSPGFKELIRPPYAISSELYTADSILIGKYFRENRSPIAYDSIAPILIESLTATEDIRFYKHRGIDFYSFFSGIWSTASGDKRGGSTLTQQLAKNLFRTRTKKSQGFIHYMPLIGTLVSKSKEWITAVKLELIYDKKEILELYLNTVSFGNNTYGIKVAAQKYFSKTPGNLEAHEAALLVGMLKATSAYNPLIHPERAMERRNVVLRLMAKHHVITNEELGVLLKKPLALMINDQSDDQSNRDSYLRAAVQNMLEEWCEENNYDIYSDGLKIYTTVDSRLQAHAEKAVAEWMRTLQRRFYYHWGHENPWRDEAGNEIEGFLFNLAKRLPGYKSLVKKYGEGSDSVHYYLNRPKYMKVFTWNGEKDTLFSTYDSLAYYAQILQSGIMTLDPFNGHIKAWVGGIDHSYFKFDHVKQAKRQAGSTFKPFVYLTAIDKGYDPCDKFIDRPVTIKYEENGEKKSWSPKNSDWVFTGYEMSLRWAMGKSCNSITAQLTEAVGWESVVAYAKKLGIESPLKAVPSVGLGPNDVSVFEMVRAYGSFLNKGIKSEPILVSKIVDNEGNVIAEFTSKQERVMSEETAWLMLYMFKGGIEEPGGTSQALWEYDIWKKGNEIGGKTGTSSNHSDGWYMGISKDLVTGVWVGADERSIHFRTSALGEGSKTALPIYGKFMEKVYADPHSGISYGKFPKPEKKIKREYYCPSPKPPVDSSLTDSLQTDSLLSLTTEMINSER